MRQYTRIAIGILGGVIGGIIMTHLIGLVALFGFVLMWVGQALGVGFDLALPPPSVIFAIAPEWWDATIFAIALSVYLVIFGLGFWFGFKFAYNRFTPDI